MLDVQVFQVSQTIWCVRRPSYFTCSYIVRTPQGIVLIDAGMNSQGKDMEAGLAHIGETPAAIQAILFTHWHNDHAAGGRALQQKSKAPVYYHADEAPFMTRQTASPGLRGRVSELLPEWGVLVLLKGLLGNAIPEPIEASALLRDGQTLLDSFEVIETPGHTPGHVSYYYPAEKALFAGDALAVLSGRVRFMARPVTPDLEAARASILRCLARDIDLLCPGHRRPLTRDTRQRCREMLDYLEKGGKWPLLG
ncbi:MAG: MBL fold metallo-hydrolase [Candidatus Sericytochromatia bacterium]